MLPLSSAAMLRVPVAETFALDDVADAYDALRRRRQARQDPARPLSRRRRHDRTAPTPSDSHSCSTTARRVAELLRRDPSAEDDPRARSTRAGAPSAASCTPPIRSRRCPPPSARAYAGPRRLAVRPALAPCWRRRGGRGAALELPSSDGATMGFVRFARAHGQAGGRELRSTCSGWTPTAAACSSRSPTRPAAASPTAPGATCSTRSRAPTSAREDGLLVLDLNFAYQPSCSYDARWTCPLAPPANRLAVAVRAGERLRGRRDPSGPQ